MAVVVTNIGTVASTGVSGVTTATITVPAGGVPVGALVVAITSEGSTALTTSGNVTSTVTGSSIFTKISGNKNAAAANGVGAFNYVSSTIGNAISSAAVLTYTKGSSSYTACMSAFYVTGLSTGITTGPIDFSTQFTGSGTQMSMAQVTSPARSGEFFIGAVAVGSSGTYTQDSTSTSWATPPNSTAQRLGGAGTGCGVGGGNIIHPSTALLTFGPQWSLTNPWIGWLVALKPNIAMTAASGSYTFTPNGALSIPKKSLIKTQSATYSLTGESLALLLTVPTPPSTGTGFLFRRPKRNPLAFPAGRKAGFDQTHPAAQGVVAGHGLSAVGNNAFFTNLLTAAKGTANVNTPTFGIEDIGTVSRLIEANATSIAMGAAGTNNDAVCTMAAIFRPTTFASGADDIIFRNTNSNGGFGLAISSAGATPQLTLFVTGTPQRSGINLTLGVPYFGAASYNSANIINFVVVNLLTGQMQTASLTSGAATSAGTGTYIIGVGSAGGGTNSMGGSVAAIMHSINSLSPGQLQQWATDPWSFWYPQPRKFYAAFAQATAKPFLLRLPRFKERSPLAYPAGRKAGFDPTHPAAKSVTRFSGIATAGGNFINLLNGGSGVPELNITGAIDGAIGPSRVDSVTAKGGVGFAGTTINDTVVTLAGIIRLSDVSNFSGVFTTTGASSGGFILAVNGGGGLGVWEYSASTFTFSGYNAVVGVPYFFAASVNGTATANFVVTRLDTGQIFSSTTTANIGIAGTPTAAFNVGNTTTGGSQSIVGSVSCAMFSAGNFLSLPQLIAWAADPWAFWYPRRRSTFAGSAAAQAVTAFLITIATGNYNLTVEQQKLLKTSLDSIQSGTYAETVESLTTLKKSLATLQVATYAFTPQQFRALKASLDKVQAGTYALTGENETLLKKSLLNIQETPYALTDEALATKKSYASAAQAGLYSLTGEQVRELKTSLQKAQSGFYALTGEQQRILRTALNNVQSGFYNVAGESLTLTFVAPSVSVALTTAFLFGMGPFAGNAFAQPPLSSAAVTAFTLLLGSGFYSLTDETLTLLKASKDGIQSGTYSLTGEQLKTLKGSVLKDTSGTYTLTGEQLTLTAARSNKAQAGFYSLTGENEMLTAARQTKAQAGFYNLTGENVSLSGARRGNVQSGFYTETGSNAVLKKTSLLNAQMTPYALTVESLTLTFSGTTAFSISIGSGSYALTDESLTLTKTSKLGVQTATYSLNDEQLTLLKTSALKGSSGSYSFTGEQLTLKAGHALSLQATPFVLTGESLGLAFSGPAVSSAITTAFLLGMGPFAGDAFAQPPLGLVNAVVTSFTLHVGSGTYTLNVENEALIAARREALQTGFYVLSGGVLILQTAFPGQFSISIGTGTYALTDETLTLVKTSKAGLQAATYTLTGEQLALLKASRLSETTGTYTLTGEQLKLTAGHLVSPQTGFYAFSSVLSLRKKSLLNSAAGFYTVSRNGLSFFFLSGPIISAPTLFGTDVGVSLSGTKGAGSLLGSRNSGINLTGGESANTLLGTDVVPGIKGGV